MHRGQGVELSEFKGGAAPSTSISIDPIESEKAKYERLVALKKRIDETYGADPQPDEESTDDTRQGFWAKFACYTLVTLDVAIPVFSGFLGAFGFGLELGVGFIFAAVSAAFLTAIEGTMMWTYFKSFWSSGLNFKEKHEENLAYHYEQRLILTKKINKKMSDMSVIITKNAATYEQFLDTLKRNDQDMRAVNLEPYQESTKKKYLRKTITASTYVFGAASAYYGLSMMFLALGVTAALGPWGLGVILIFIAVNFATKYFLRSQAVYNFINPEAAHQNKVAKELANFKNEKLINFDLQRNVLINNEEATKATAKLRLLEQQLKATETALISATGELAEVSPGKLGSSSFSLFAPKPQVAQSNENNIGISSYLFSLSQNLP